MAASPTPERIPHPLQLTPEQLEDRRQDIAFAKIVGGLQDSESQPAAKDCPQAKPILLPEVAEGSRFDPSSIQKPEINLSRAES